MTLEKNVVDTMKEWQIKIGNFDSNIRLFYPKVSICRYLNKNMDMDNELLCRCAEQYFAKNAEYLGSVKVSVEHERFCVLVEKEGCSYVEKNVPMPEFLMGLLKALRTQKMDSVARYFEEYAALNSTLLYKEKDEDDGGSILYFSDENVEPYVYCIDENEFGITYHRFTKEDYFDLYNCNR